MKIDIDLNKLTLEELNQFVNLAKKSKGEENDKEVAPRVEQKVIVVQPKKLGRPRKGKKFDMKLWDGRFIEMQRLMHSGMSKTNAMKSVAGYVLQDKVRKIFERFLKKKTDKRVVFMNFINERSKKYTVQGYSNSEARKLASADYREQRDKPKKVGEYIKPKAKVGEYMIKPKAKVPESPTEARLRLARQMAKPKVVTEFPKFKTVQEVYQPILHSIVRNMLELETKITYPSEGLLLDIAEDDWKEFLSEFFSNSNDIASYFKVPNNFKIRYNEVQYLK